MFDIYTGRIWVKDGWIDGGEEEGKDSLVRTLGGKISYLVCGPSLILSVSMITVQGTK